MSQLALSEGTNDICYEIDCLNSSTSMTSSEHWKIANNIAENTYSSWYAKKGKFMVGALNPTDWLQATRFNLQNVINDFEGHENADEQWRLSVSNWIAHKIMELASNHVHPDNITWANLDPPSSLRIDPMRFTVTWTYKSANSHTNLGFWLAKWLPELDALSNTQHLQAPITGGVVYFGNKVIDPRVGNALVCFNTKYVVAGAVNTTQPLGLFTKTRTTTTIFVRRDTFPRLEGLYCS